MAESKLPLVVDSARSEPSLPPIPLVCDRSVEEALTRHFPESQRAESHLGCAVSGSSDSTKTPAICCFFEHRFYAVPDVTLWHQSDRCLNSLDLLGSGMPVILHCLTNPSAEDIRRASMIWVEIKRHLSAAAIKPIFVTIPVNHHRYASALLMHDASTTGAEWTLLSAKNSDMARVLAAFNAPRWDTGPASVYFIQAPDDTWTRIEGSASAEFLAEMWKFVNA